MNLPYKLTAKSIKEIKKQSNKSKILKTIRPMIIHSEPILSIPTILFEIDKLDSHFGLEFFHSKTVILPFIGFGEIAEHVLRREGKVIGYEESCYTDHLQPLYSYGKDRFSLNEETIFNIFGISIYSRISNATILTSKPWEQISDVIFICLCPNFVWFNLFFEPLVQASMNRHGLFSFGRAQIIAISTTKKSDGLRIGYAIKPSLDLIDRIFVGKDDDIEILHYIPKIESPLKISIDFYLYILSTLFSRWSQTLGKNIPLFGAKTEELINDLDFDPYKIKTKEATLDNFNSIGFALQKWKIAKYGPDCSYFN